MKIVILEPIGIEAGDFDQIKADFERLGCELISYDSRPNSDTEIIKRVVQADVIVLSNLPLSEQVIGECQNLKMISVAFAGVDHLPMDLCRAKNILVSNAAGYSNHAVAELVIGSAISLYRKIHWNDLQTRKSSTREGFLGSELNTKVFGVIGAGQIGSQVAHLANAFGCRVLAYSRSFKNIPNVEFCTLDYLLEQCDIVSVHVPLTTDTKHLINKDNLQKLKSSAILINTARGPIVDYTALSEALKNDRIAGSAIDVYEKEPPLEQDHPLFNAPNTILLPHIGYATIEAIKLRTEISFKNIRMWLNQTPQNVMN